MEVAVTAVEVGAAVAVAGPLQRAGLALPDVSPVRTGRLHPIRRRFCGILRMRRWTPPLLVRPPPHTPDWSMDRCPAPTTNAEQRNLGSQTCESDVSLTPLAPVGGIS